MGALGGPAGAVIVGLKIVAKYRQAQSASLLRKFTPSRVVMYNMHSPFNTKFTSGNAWHSLGERELKYIHTTIIITSDNIATYLQVKLL